MIEMTRERELECVISDLSAECREQRSEITALKADAASAWDKCEERRIEIASLKAQLEFEKREHIDMQKYTLSLEKKLAEREAEIDSFKESMKAAGAHMRKQSEDLAEREAEIAKLRGLLPTELPNSFISFGKYYSEASTKFAPANDPMSKFKRKWFLECAEALSTPPSSSYLEQWEKDRYQVVAIVGELSAQTRSEVIRKDIAIGAYLYARKD
jgi:hypothetical protein